MEGAVAGDGREEAADRGDPALAGGLGALDDERRGAHADHHAVTAAVERKGRVLHLLVERGGARGDEPGADPLHHVVGRGVVGRDDQDAAAAAGADPVLGEARGKPHRAAGRVDLRVRAARADQLGELRVPHREDPEEEAAIEGVVLLLEELPEGGDLLVDVGEGLRGDAPGGEGGAERLQLGEALAALVVDVVALDALGEGVVARGKPRRR